LKLFAELPLPEPLLRGVESIGYQTLTEIQAGALPPMLQGLDIVAQARTGSGKTAAFGLALLARLPPNPARLQSLVLCPTRELADQVCKEIRALARFVPNIKILALCGGVPIRAQLASLTHEPHIVVGTPGRIQELLRREALRLDALECVVLDEADRMLDMGFVDAMRAVLRQAPAARNTWLFSATYSEEIRRISGEFQRAPLDVTVQSHHDETVIVQRFYRVEPGAKVDAIVSLLLEQQPASCLVFCNTRVDTREVTQALWKRGIPVIALHGELEQRERDEALLQFANGSFRVMVATDVAARGLDIESLAMVIAHELPNDADTHVHRIGRTGRAGQSGLALSLVASREMERVAAIEALPGTRVEWCRLPSRGESLTLPVPAMKTLLIEAGRQQKLRPGDIVGALTGEAGLHASQIGTIDIFADRSYVAIEHALLDSTLQRMRNGKIKGRNIRVRKLQ
jgi:ATP-dependent RNA helicase DbpA